MIDREVRRATGSTIATATSTPRSGSAPPCSSSSRTAPTWTRTGATSSPSTQHLWITDDDGTLASYVRVLAEPDGSLADRRVVTDPAHRGSRLAGQLLDAALDGVTGPVVLAAQSHLTHVYERHGFVADGDEFLDDGIPHTPMRRADAA